jgi:MFS transporter, AAHS family, 4-hydroxybenzoate transporter
MGLGTGGAIALAATIYPTPIRSTGAGWGMAMGRFGQIVGPLIAGALLGVGWTAGPIMTVTASGGLIGAIFVVLFSVWLSRRRVEGLSASEAPAKTPVPV